MRNKVQRHGPSLALLYETTEEATGPHASAAPKFGQGFGVGLLLLALLS